MPPRALEGEVTRLPIVRCGQLLVSAKRYLSVDGARRPRSPGSVIVTMHRLNDRMQRFNASQRISSAPVELVQVRKTHVRQASE
jgi:hypothetical protein